MARQTFAEGYLYLVARTENSDKDDMRGFHGNDFPPVDDDDLVWIADVGPDGYIVLSDYSSDANDFEVVEGWKMERAEVPEVGHVYRDDVGYSIVIRRDKDGEVEVVSYY
jgi:hypothetical protein